MLHRYFMNNYATTVAQTLGALARGGTSDKSACIFNMPKPSPSTEYPVIDFNHRLCGDGSPYVGTLVFSAGAGPRGLDLECY